MGASPYYYFVPYEPDINEALQRLRQREFAAGRYYPAMTVPTFPVNADSPAPGAQHASIEEAIEDADAEGTCSILDLDHIADEPDFGAVVRADDALLEELYGTAQPTREMLEANRDFFNEVERGQGIYIIAYRDGKPSEILFAGYSCD